MAGKKATSQQTIVKLLELSRRDHLPLSWTFVQQRTVDGKPSAGPLAAFVGAHHERALQQYLLLHAAVSAESEEEGWSVARDSRVWARALGLPEQMPAARAAVSKNWAWLEKRQLVTRGRLSEVHLLYDDGSGDPYEHPADRNDSYLKLPYEFWRDEWHRELGLAGVTVLLIALTLRDGFYLPGDRVGAWYGISSSTLTKGFRALRQRQLLDVRRDAKTAELAPEGSPTSTPTPSSRPSDRRDVGEGQTRAQPVVKRVDLERHLRAHDCSQVREGAKHSVWENPRAKRRSTIPRHRELPLGTARAICRQLHVPRLS